MRLSTVFSVALVVLPAFQDVSAGLVPRQNNGAQRNRGGNNGANNGANNGGNAGANNGQNGANGANNGGNAGQNNGNNGGQNNGDPQASLTLDPKVIAPGFAQNGQDPPVAGQVASLTSTNNFINFCLTVPNLPITNGQQIQGGSCNPAPIGAIPSVDKMPAAKFLNPKNFATIASDTTFNIQVNVINLQTGNFVNAQKNYFAAPQTLNGAGLIVGHSHITCDKLAAIDSTTPNNPQTFAFFKGLNDAAQNGVLSATVDGGLPAGAYRCCTINSSANHAPAIAPVAQHASLDDCSYFTATPGGAAAGGANGGQNNGGAGAGGANGGANNGAGGANGGAGAGGANNGAGGANGGAGAGGANGGANNGAGAGGANGGAAGGANGGQNGGANGGAAAGGANGGAGAGANNGAGGAGANGGAGAAAGGANGGANNGAGANNGGRPPFGGQFGQGRGGRGRRRQ